MDEKPKSLGDTARETFGSKSYNDYEGPYRNFLTEAWEAAAQAVAARVQSETIDKCARIAADACLVPPDGGSPTEDERLVCEEAARRIRCLGSEEVTS